MPLTVRGGGETRQLAFGSAFVGGTRRVVERSEIADAEMVFVGYGVVAPEYGWNDYEGIDARGKTVVILVNDPGFASGDTTLFNGRAMTYYGRWTYKYEEAARQGAAGAVVVHRTEPAGYPWEVVETGWTGPQFDLVRADGNMSRAALEGWVSEDAARRIFAQGGADFDSLSAAAAAPGFRAVPLELTASVTIRNTIARSTSRNVLAVLPGTDRADEYVVYMAHWDHMGVDRSRDGDQIYNGAKDNASGTAGIVQIAKAFAALDPRPARSILFLAVTAEEQGLLGSAYYATNPVYPLAKTVAAINLDGLNLYGRMRDITVIGMGNSELDDYLADAATGQDRYLRPDPEAEKGYYYRSDHFNFAKEGVPALYTDAGIDHVEHGEEYGLAQRAEWVAERYHQPSDEYDPDWDLTGAIDDLQLFFRVGYRIANESTFPAWEPGTEFRARRDSMLAGQ